MTTVFFKFKSAVRVELIHRQRIVKVDRQFRNTRQAERFLQLNPALKGQAS